MRRPQRLAAALSVVLALVTCLFVTRAPAASPLPQRAVACAVASVAVAAAPSPRKTRPEVVAARFPVAPARRKAVRWTPPARTARVPRHVRFMRFLI